MNKNIFLILICVLFVAGEVCAESITLTTYFSAPFGAYDRLRLVPKGPGNDYTNPCTGKEGTLYVTNAGELTFCQAAGVWGPVATGTGSGGIFVQTDDDIITADDTNIDLLHWGVGTTTPEGRLHLAQGLPVDWATQPSLFDFLITGGNSRANLVGVNDSGYQSAMIFSEVDLLSGAFTDAWILGRTSSGAGSDLFLSYTLDPTFASSNRILTLQRADVGDKHTGYIGLGDFGPGDPPQATFHIRGDGTVKLEDSSTRFTMINTSAGYADFEIHAWHGDQTTAWPHGRGDQLFFAAIDDGWPDWKQGLNLSATGNLAVNWDLPPSPDPGAWALPPFKLYLHDDAGILAGGIFGSGATLPAQTASARMIWYPRKAAFRAGFVVEPPLFPEPVPPDNWENVNIGTYSTAVGYDTLASKIGSTAWGYESSATGNYSTAIGYMNTANNTNSMAFGSETLSSGLQSTAFGYQTQATGPQSTAMGYQTMASGTAATAMGRGTTASGDYATATGHGTVASGDASFAMGDSTTASGLASFAMGEGIEAQGDYSFAFALDANQSGVVVAQNSTLAIMGGRVGIGTKTPSSILTVPGLTNSSADFPVVVDKTTGNFYFKSSSRRYKTDIKPLADDFFKVLDIQPVSFVDKKNGLPGIGVIAEDIDDIGLKRLVIYGEDGTIDGFQYDKVALYLLEVLKDPRASTDPLAQEIAELTVLVCDERPDAAACRNRVLDEE